jgi:tetratricopeptide (TPR) repeat protein
LYDNELWTYVGDIGARSAGYFTLPGYWYELFDVTRLAYRAVRRLAESDARGVYLLGIGQALMLLGFSNDAAAALTEALEATAKSGDQELELGVLETLLPIYQETNATAAARQSAERILTLVEQRDDPHLLTQALAVLSQMLLRSEDQAEHLPRAIELAERALALQHSLGSQEDLLEAVLNASVVWSQAGDSTRALEYGEQAVDMARRLRNRALEAAALLQLGETYSRHGEPRRVLRTYEKALEAARRSNVKPLVALSSWRLANSVEQSGNGRAALKYYEQCLAALDPAEVRDPTPAAVQAKIAALRN